MFRGGMLFLGSAEENAAPSPLLSLVGISLPLRFSEYILVEPAVQFHGTWYGDNQIDSVTRPVPMPLEDREAWVLSVLFDPAFRAEVPLADTTAFGLSLAPAFVFRFPLLTEADAEFDRSAVINYFYSSGRFFFPRGGVYLSWKATEKVALRFQLDAWLPLYHAWDGGSAPFWDDLLVCGWVGFSITLPAK